MAENKDDKINQMLLNSAPTVSNSNSDKDDTGESSDVSSADNFKETMAEHQYQNAQLSKVLTKARDKSKKKEEAKEKAIKSMQEAQIAQATGNSSDKDNSSDSTNSSSDDDTAVDKDDLSQTKDNQGIEDQELKGLKTAQSQPQTSESSSTDDVSDTSKKSDVASKSTESADNVDTSTDTSDSNTTASAESSQSSASNSSSASDVAMTSQGQKNLAQNQNKNTADNDLQDFTAPNIFVERALSKHNNLIQNIKDGYNNKTLNTAPIVRTILKDSETSFTNMCWAINQIYEDTKRRNNQLEKDTEVMQSNAMKGEKTIRLWEQEGIFADLQKEASLILAAYKSPALQSFLKNNPQLSRDIKVPQPLQERGEKAKAEIQKQQAAKDKQKGDSK